jgi:polysaccharide biosynthesis/export protein ExoF
MSTFYIFANYMRTFLRCLVPTRKNILLVCCTLLMATAFNANAATLPDYKLSVGDVLEFDYLDDLELPRQLAIGFGGKVQVPILGAVQVSGLTLDEAIETIRKQLVDRKLLNDPAFTLSVFTYRPVYVIGDVRNPGMFPFHANLTVEQSVGLAGGLLSVQSSAESRIVARSQLQGELYGTDSEITRQAVWAARLTAELDGRERIALSDLPAKSKPYLETSSVDEFMVVENKILAADIAALVSQRSTLSTNILATKNQLELFDKIAKNQEIAVKFTQDERNRVDKLLKSGLKTANDMTDVQRQLTIDDGRLLQILADKGNAVLRNATLEQQLAALEDGWKKDALIALQERNAALQLLLAKRRATEEQLYLVTNWAAVEAENSKQSVIHYKVRSRTEGQKDDLIVSANDQLFPGDVLIVSVEQPEPTSSKTTSLP